ncbi:hypothetical protein VTL71DRAFT_14842 [Oculimacula yallundae]|uniref:ubiquitinyl hydrolase 1 n=1 Tax=Oculimacula yallundae TaxID=86028 RepID=A0ABR4CEX9_9HELO
MSTTGSLLYIIDHVFLPLKLPQKDDSDYAKDFALGKQCQAALMDFRKLLPTPAQQHWKWTSSTKMLCHLLALRDASDGAILGNISNSIAEMNTNDVFALHVRGQNAGLICRKMAEYFSFEAFELSPTTEAVVGAKGRLIRCFPGPAIKLDHERLEDQSFREALAQVLTSLDIDTPAEVYKVVSKSRSHHNIEIRESVHPRFVTEMLTGMLRGIGESYDPTRFYKRTRDDVLWDNTLHPWRRSPFWLLLRVTLQTILMANASTHNEYKAFMVYFMAYLLQLALHQSLPSETLFLMAEKISRRTYKLALGDQQTGVHYVQRVLDATQQELARRWNTIQHNPDPLGLYSSWKATRSSFLADTDLSLRNLRPYMDRIWTRAMVLPGAVEFESDCPSRIDWKGDLPELDYPCPGGDYSTRLRLLDLDLWVQKNLHDWTSANLESEVACARLSALLRVYATSAMEIYGHDPDNISLKLLTIMELWIALDRCAAHQHSLLKMYSPGFPPALLHPLLLPKRDQMVRLISIERYLQQRLDDSLYPSSFVFQITNETNSFAVKYFDQSSAHHTLRREIEAAAQIERAAKKSELAQKTRKYYSLLQESDCLSHEQGTRWDGYEYIPDHPYSCQKCELKREADNLEISVHEWPLPYKDLEAKSAVFELIIPVSIAEWRDATFSLLEDVFSPCTEAGPCNTKVYQLREYVGLIKYGHGKVRRLQLASETKSFLVAHYRNKKISQAEEKGICVNNGLHYSLYDTTLQRHTCELLGRVEIRRLCTFQLPPGPHATLQYALDNTTHTSNEALSKQDDCPKDFNLHEYYVFATLRSGHRLQWRNIAREVTARILNFGHYDTYMLVAQAIWHAGPSRATEILRDSHIDLEEEEFGASLMSSCEEVLETVEGSWQGATALRTLVILATRLISLTPYDAVRQRCYQFLSKARLTSLQWSRELGSLHHDEQDVEEVKHLSLRTLEVALICHSTFDVDEIYHRVLLRSEDNIAAVTECCIFIHDRCPARTDGLDTSMRLLLRDFERTAHLMEGELRSRILGNRTAIDRTVKRIWAGYREGSPWTHLPKPNERWLTTQTCANANSLSNHVHYNLLDGSLLINGSPLTRLPQSYELHTTYTRIFGEKVLDVIPSSMPGMLFEIRGGFHGHQVHFRMCESELIVRIQQQEQTYEMIPISALAGDFPQSFVEDFVHFLDLTTQSIEWRPLSSMWSSSRDNWEMRGVRNGYSLTCMNLKLLDIRSPNVQAISSILSVLERAIHVHVVLDRQTDTLQIRLPRMKLDFSLKEPGGFLESKQFRGMVWDECQSLGTFTGLVNKLVLRNIIGSSRCVIIPDGSITFVSEGHHVAVRISPKAVTHVDYHLYHIDRQLGRLIDNGSLYSRLFRLYLHATTSHCLVDELTGRTGTEEALYGLDSAATRSFVALSPGNIDLLEKFACLTPTRSYYPKHLNMMQQVKWNTLPSLSQHPAFFAIVASIFQQATSLQIFQEQSNPIPTVDRGSALLLKKAAIRSSSAHAYGFGAGSFTIVHDTFYKARDRVDSKRELQTYQIARLVDSWSQELEVCPQLLAEIESWGEIISGPNSRSIPTLGFDTEWLHQPSEIFPIYWTSLHDCLSQARPERDKYRIMMLLSTLTYSQVAKQSLVQTLLAFATVPALRIVQQPYYEQLQLKDGYALVINTLQKTIRRHAKKFQACPEARLEILLNETKHAADARRHNAYELGRDECMTAFVNSLVRQGSTSTVQTPSGSNYSTYIVVKQAMRDVRPLFQSWHNNCQFRTYVNQLQAILATLRPKKQDLQRYSFLLPANDYVSAKAYIGFEDLTAQPAPQLPETERQTFQEWVARSKGGASDDDRLRELISRVTDQCSSSHERQYAADLHKSLEAMSIDSSPSLITPENFTSILEAHLNQAQHDVLAMHKCICDYLQAGLHSMTRTSQLLPRLSPTAILSQLSHDKIINLPEKWKLSLVRYGLTITVLQRAERLLAVKSNPAAFIDELENPGHQGWDPVKHPEWLLLEIENNILIRQEQAEISHEMIDPSSGSNSVMQLNMGRGKSSTIVPISAIDLANGDKLARVIVLRPLAMQMFQLLVKKLGSMVNRRIVYMPISRSLGLDVRQAQQIQEMYADCARTGSIILTQPEHILSFELLGLERLLTNPDLGKVMVETQNWLQMRSRDILDESDEILSVKFELVYTMGIQRAVEFSPERWAIIQHALGVLSDVAKSFHEEDPHGIEVIPTASRGRFPRIRILQASSGAVFLDKVAWQLCKIGLPNLNMWSMSLSVREGLYRFVTRTGSTAEGEGIQSNMTTSDFMVYSLLLLRGLFACGVLKFAFAQKRWRVNYGLDPTRTRLAVPYHAKDSPAARAEFSHPDVTIVLTCLSYYYDGLDDTQICACFEVLFQSDQATEEYERWVKDAPDLAPCFRHLTGINLADQGQCSRNIFPPLRFAKGLIDFYLSTVVFPAEMKEFPMKLSSSGWDIARRKAHPTTGFSGTNDSRYILPLSVIQHDLPAQLSTNAAVLKCLLRPENSFVDVTQHSRSGFLNAYVLLDLAISLDPPVRVILDVGAQVLELQNEAFADAWLLRSPNAQAVIFFDAQNEICVLTRDGGKEPLQVSPFVNQMDQCLVYLDESHTRGTDLKLPDDYRALVTLGPSLTKDRLVQACMRMRKLGKGQSVIFCSSSEVQRKIQEHKRASGEGSIGVQDVLAWCISGTCIQTKRSVPLWATQGLRHLHRQKTYLESPVTQRLVGSLLEPEAQSLQERYGNASTHHKTYHRLDTSIVTDGSDQLNAIHEKCREFEIQSLAKAALQEEQERELSPENEREQQVELPQRIEPQKHSLHPDLWLLVVYGKLNRHSHAFQPAFDIFSSTTARTLYEASAWPTDLLVTSDFASTVCSTSDQSNDSFLRPVQWILSCKNRSEIIYVILSPYEAHEILPHVRQSSTATLHVYSPRLSMSVRTLEDLSFCAIPPASRSVPTPAITTQLNLFAGQLYFRSHEDYRFLARFLGICSNVPDDHVEVALDGFVSPAQRDWSDPGWNAICPFETSPIAFVHAVMSLRRKGQSMKFSHLGRVLSGELISTTHFDSPH